MRERLEESAPTSGARPPRESAGRPNGWPARCATPAPARCASRRSRWPTAPSGGRSVYWLGSGRLPGWPPAAAAGCQGGGGSHGRGGIRADRRRAAPGRRRFRRMLPAEGASRPGRDRARGRRADDRGDVASRRRAHGLLLQPGHHRGGRPERPLGLRENDTSPPLMWPVVAGPGIVAAGAALGSRGLTGLGTFVSAGAPPSWPISAQARSSQRPMTTARRRCPFALARTLSERPPENTRVLFLSTSEEALCEGMGMFMERHADELPRASTFFLCLEILGSPDLLVLRGEGMLKMREYPAESLELLDSTAQELGIALLPNLRIRNATDASSRSPPATSARRWAPATSGRTRRTTTGRRIRRRTSTTGRSPTRSGSQRRSSASSIAAG